MPPAFQYQQFVSSLRVFAATLICGTIINRQEQNKNNIKAYKYTMETLDIINPPEVDMTPKSGGFWK